MKPPIQESSDTVLERLFFAVLGGATGAIYGLILSALVGLVAGEFLPRIVMWSAISFTVAGVFFGNVIGEAFVALLYFLWGFINGAIENPNMEIERNQKPHLLAFAVIGLVTGFVLFLAWYP